MADPPHRLQKFERLTPSRKQLVDTVKMVAYRAETAMASIVHEKLARKDDARSLLRDLFRSEADLVPDLEQRVFFTSRALAAKKINDPTHG